MTARELLQPPVAPGRDAGPEGGLDEEAPATRPPARSVSWLIAANVPLPAIQARLGHESITTTVDRYGHLVQQLDDEDDIRLGKQWLVQNGFRGESIAYPGGEYQKTTDGVGIDSIANRYVSTGRTILFQSGYPTETFPAGMPMRVRAVSSISSTQAGANNPANLVATGGLLDKCQLNGGWLILVFHKITTGAATVTTECSQSDFQTVMAGIASRGIPVVPVSDVMRLYS